MIVNRPSRFDVNEIRESYSQDLNATRYMVSHSRHQATPNGFAKNETVRQSDPAQTNKKFQA